MEQKTQMLKDLGLNTDEGTGYTGGGEKYIAAVVKYVTSCDDNIREVLGLYESGNMEHYAVKIHALKSNSRMIGHTALFKAFESLEHAARNGDTDFVKAHHNETMELYTEFVKSATPLAESRKEPDAPAISAEEAAETAEELLTALDDFDDELSAQLAAKLSGYPFAGEDKNRIVEAKKYIGDYMYDEAAEIVKELRDSIK